MVRILFITASLLVAGCSQGPKTPKVEMLPVKGTISAVDGKPYQGLMILFRSVPNGDFAPSGDINDKGEFKLATVVGEKKVEGAPAGEYTIMVVPPSTSQNVLPIELKKRYKIEAGQVDLRIQME